jgi:dTMP kinase
VFITFEGPEGCGKSTQAHLLYEALKSKGFDCLLTREPGGTILAEKVRDLLLNPIDGECWDYRSELLLVWAARIQHWNQVIHPSLQSGNIVICDRFFDSTRAYQGYGRGGRLDFIDDMEKKFGFNMVPQKTFIFKGDIDCFLQRARHRLKDSHVTLLSDVFEKQDTTFHQNVYKGFLDILEKNPTRCVGIEVKDIQQTHDEIIYITQQIIKKK